MDREHRKVITGFEVPTVPPHGVLGQFSYAPATHTTVVTTTTTTTTTFPPFSVSAPKGLLELDPEQYPLAHKPTPSAVKKVEFKVDGKSAYFEEAEDTELRVRQLNKQYASLAAHQGSICSIADLDGDVASERLPPRSTTKASKRKQQAQQPNGFPASITPSSTPSMTYRCFRQDPEEAPWPHKFRRPHPLQQSQEPMSEGEAFGELEQYQYLGEDLEPSAVQQPARQSLHALHSESTRLKPDHPPVNMKTVPFGGSVTPPDAEEASGHLHVNRVRCEPRRRPAAPNMLKTSPVVDASLPSPTLSPVTAAANLVRPTTSQLTEEETEDEAHGNFTVVPPGTDTQRTLSIPSQIELPKIHDATFDNAQLPTPGLTDLPTLLNSFDIMPAEMKTYVMYQFLRRCAKPTLKFVAGVVNPALKYDFLARLPLELSLKIVRSLDVQSMCRAAQVSKKWRHIVDSDEKAWKDLLDADGFKLPKGEVQQAVQEGWGWQCPTRDNSEVDINPEPARNFDPRLLAAPNHLSDRLGGFEEHLEMSMSTRKRKMKSQGRVLSQKKQKRKVSSLGDGQRSAWMAWLDEAHGPNAFASAAAAYVPAPRIGLPSLRNLHLFKSIYARHHLIRRSWMDTEKEPLHLAFRAHHRHVVTCLQFDSDKIVTGSDDANIDIYNTQTGAAIKRLEGHEGGVWALEYQGNMLVSGSTDRTLRMWNIEEGRCLQVWQGHTSTVRCLQIIHPVPVGYNPDGSIIMMPKESLIITGSRDSSCRVWKLPELDDESLFQMVANDDQNPYFVRALAGHHHSVRAIAAHGDTLVSGSYDATVRVWKISTGETIHRLQGHTTKVYSVVLDNERGRCISGSMDSFVKIWSLETGSCLLHLEGHASLVGLLDLKDNYLVSAAADAILRIWDPETGRCKHSLTGHTGAITCFSHNGEKVVSGSDSTLKLWDTKKGEFVRDLLTTLSGVWQVRFDDRRCIAAVHRNNWTYIEVIDFGASRDGVHETQLGRRIVVDSKGREVQVQEEEVIPVSDAGLP